MILHDLRCRSCERVERGVLVETGRYGTCENCGEDRTWLPAGLHTDVYGSPQYSDATGMTHGSQHEKRKHLRRLGYQEAGDKVGGARNDTRIKNIGYSYVGQKRMTSTGERHESRNPKWTRD